MGTTGGTNIRQVTGEGARNVRRNTSQGALTNVGVRRTGPNGQNMEIRGGTRRLSVPRTEGGGVDMRAVRAANRRRNIRNRSGR